MALFGFCVKVIKATGEQVWRVEADSPEAAIEAYKRGWAWMTDEQLTAEELADIDLADVYEVE